MKKAAIKFRTFNLTPQTHKPKWVLIDLKGKTLGRVSTKIADLLRGKDSPSYTKHVDSGNYVVVINAAEVKLTGKKMTQKEYNSHSRFPGGLKTITAEKLLQKNAAEVIEHSVAGMLPNNKHKKHQLKKLKVFNGPEHNLQAQNPQPLEI